MGAKKEKNKSNQRTFSFRKEDQMPPKTHWLDISVLLLHNRVKDSYFQINYLSMNWFAYGNKSSLFGKFPFSEPFMWTMDWHNTQCELIIKILQRERHLKITCFVKIIVRAKCVAIMLE